MSNPDFTDSLWLFTSDHDSRGLARLNIGEAGLIWQTVRRAKVGVVEIGRYRGGSASLIAAAIADLNIPFTSVDKGLVLSPACGEYLQARQQQGQTIHLQMCDSKVFTPEHSCDVVFIDGDHSYDGVRSDFINICRYLVPDSIVMFHDAVLGSCGASPGVIRLIKELKQMGCLVQESQIDSLVICRLLQQPDPDLIGTITLDDTLPDLPPSAPADLAQLPEPDISILGEPFVSRLEAMYAGKPQLGLDNNPYPIDGGTRVTRREGLWLFNACKELNARKTLEVGLAFGYSALYMLAWHKSQESSEHVAIDPGQDNIWWRTVGRANCRDMGFGPGSERFRFLNGTSAVMLGHLVGMNEKFDLIFIDGDHKFDSIMVDFYLASQLVRTGGYIVLHDRWMQSTRSAKNFIRNNRPDFVELPHVTPVGLTDFVIYKRVGIDTREWHHFEKFKIADPLK